MIVNTPAVDYWRATSGVMANYTDTLMELFGTLERGEDARGWGFLQYKGDLREGVGHGQAIQGEKMSYMIDIPGMRSDELLGNLIYSDMKVTRLDLQFTVKKPNYWDTWEFMFHMESGTWEGSPRDVTARINKGNDTVYIGDRTSDKFIRVYVKQEDWIRFEVEFKQKRAVKAWDTVRQGRRHAIAGILISELEKLPTYPLLADIRRDLQKMSPPVSIQVESVKTTDLKRLKWLASLLPTIRKMMNDHDYGNMVSGWFVDLIEEKLQDEE